MPADVLATRTFSTSVEVVGKVKLTAVELVTAAPPLMTTLPVGGPSSWIESP
jgi:hypothetical protein